MQEWERAYNLVRVRRIRVATSATPAAARPALVSQLQVERRIAAAQGGKAGGDAYQYVQGQSSAENRYRLLGWQDELRVSS